MASNNKTGIEKLKELADQIEREHEEELQELKERYKIDLREAREARDIAIKEAAEYNNQLGDIIEYLGSCSRKKPVLSSQGRYERIMSELDKSLMPPGMEWPPKDSEGEDLSIGDKAHFLRTEHDGDHEWHDVVTAFRHQGIEGEGDVWIVEGEHGEAFACDCTKLPEPDTQERIDEDVCKVADACTYFSSDGSCTKCRFVSQYGDADSAYEACPESVELERMAVLDLLRRQRELDARTMGGE